MPVVAKGAKMPVKRGGVRPAKAKRDVPSRPAPPPPRFHRRTILLLLFFCLIIIARVIVFKPKVEEQPSQAAVETGGAGKQVVAVPGQPSQAAGISTLPEIVSIKLTPPSPVTGDRIKAEVQTRDGEAVATSYQWAINGAVIPETTDTLSVEFKRGDKVSLTAAPSNKRGKGTPITVFTHIFNTPPVITSFIQDSRFNDGFAYQIKAEDADNDPLKYSLRFAPEGMAIDPGTGLINWTPPPGFKGTVHVMALVTDGAGGEARQIFNLQLDQEQIR